ncbi:metalloregulator ArsR/SmtB family transcription factor [Modestobacter sp. I12A-02628]|uniref:Helix-turn-helix transcriptional regulator n=1 Tax=Goekera deserti TaxID=2497753 RepID=A0A7K3WAY9_9ACTN|nr:metalloregulator ArsR/SmtB family transcription factor [Goekera deserti]MPQ97510.1 metalloregulator ArsR/SmtB family transcription factor [Goekera deserti]NDI47887.1 metalloregulator ArsR/SmtB family transcription factor [Goekera deserti]NEL53635.1 helix-turn-helix transcriptional regulator [Goekera deserti]
MHPDPPAAARVGPAADVQAAAELLGALSAPLRLSIITLLDEHGSRCVHQLVEALGAPQPLVSQHLRVLRGASLVVGERRRREVHYRLVDAHVGAIVRAAVDHARHAVTDPAAPARAGDAAPGATAAPLPAAG